jgi:hypothetical protein
MFLEPSVGLWTLFRFVILYRVSRTPWTGDQPITKLLPTHRTTQTPNKRTQTAMLSVGFKPTTTVFEWAKPVHALDCAVPRSAFRKSSSHEIRLHCTFRGHNQNFSVVKQVVDIVTTGL